MYRSVSHVVIRRGDIFYADLRPVVGSEQGGIRPVLIIQNDVGNLHSPTVICADCTERGFHFQLYRVGQRQRESVG